MDRHVLITGASRGIGKAIALALCENFTVVLNYRSNEDAAQDVLRAVQEKGGQGRLLPFDISDRATAVAAVEEDMAEHGAYWGVVLNAGVTADAPLPAMDEVAWDRVIHTNLDGFYNVLKPVVMPMIRKKKGGRIVTMSSLAGVAGNRGQTNYAASKGGIIAATRSLARELAKRQITVNSVAPGMIATDMTADLDSDISAEIIKSIPMRRMGKPEEIAGVVAFLFSEAAGYITGEVINVNGGLL